MGKDITKLKEFQKWFDSFVKRNYGKKCREFTWNCPLCHAYFVKELFDDFVDDLVETEKWFQKQNKKSKKIQKKKII
jgi:hypothetical protein